MRVEGQWGPLISPLVKEAQLAILLLEVPEMQQSKDSCLLGVSVLSFFMFVTTETSGPQNQEPLSKVLLSGCWVCSSAPLRRVWKGT